MLLAQLGRELGLVFEPEADEEGLGELALRGAIGDRVDVFQLAGEIEGHVEGAPDASHVLLGERQGLLGVGDALSQAVLLASEQVDREGVGVVGLEHLLALILKLTQSAPLATPFPGALGGHARPRLVQGISDLIKVGGPTGAVSAAELLKAHVAVGLPDLSLDRGGREVGLPAAGPLLATDAGEVVVEGAELAAGPGVNQALAAAAA